MKSDRELSAIIQQQIHNGIGSYGAELEDQMADALDYYNGEPYGNEAEGRSQFITREVFESVEWLKGELLKVFASGQRYVIFKAHNEEDEDQAKQETDYTNYVIMDDNDGFQLAHDIIHDTALMKLAYAKVYTEEKEEVNYVEYSGLTETQLALILEGDENTKAELEAADGYFNGLEDIYNAEVKETSVCKEVKVEVIPQEQMVISRNAKSINLDECSFIAQESSMTVSDIIQEYDISFEEAKELPDHNEFEQELAISRQQTEDEDLDLQEATDDSMREKSVYQSNIMIDMDGDGIAELWKVISSGKKILYKEQIPEVEYVAFSMIPQPHKHVGKSPAELVMDIQLQKSVLVRQIFDNLYLTNNPEKEVVQKNVNLNDLLTSEAGGIKRVKEAGSINPLVVPFTAGQSIPMLEILDTMREDRTGQSRHTKGLDADVLRQSTLGAFKEAVSKSNALTEKLARVLAETGFKQLFKKIHSLSTRTQNKPRTLKLNNDYVEVNPSEWNERNGLEVIVGLGTDSKDQMMSQLIALAEKQEQHLLKGSPLVTPKNLYNTYAKMIEISGLKTVTDYFVDPDTLPPPAPPQPQPNPLAEVEQIKQQGAIQRDQMKYFEDAKGKIAQLNKDIKIAQMNNESRENIAILQAEKEALIAGFNLDLGEQGMGAELA